MRRYLNFDLTFQCLTDPGLSPCEVEAKRLNRLRAEACLRPTVETSGEAARLEELVLQQGKDIIVIGRDTCSGEPQVHEDWVHFAEQVPSLLIKALPYVSNKEGMQLHILLMTAISYCSSMMWVGFLILWRTSLFMFSKQSYEPPNFCLLTGEEEVLDILGIT